LATATGSGSGKARIHLSGVFDGSRAMELANWLRRERATEISVDFSDVDRFEAFGVEVLFRELAGLTGAGATVRCRGIPPCVSERLDALGIAVTPSPRHPRWAPWAP